MPTFYRGAGLDTYWHTNDSREVGFTARAPDTLPTTAELITHIATNTMNSPYVSLTCSYRVAVSYAMLGGRRRPTPEQPAYLYEIQINEPLPIGIRLIDPIKEIAPILPDPTVEEVHRYQHGGYPNFLLGIVEPRLRSFLAGQPRWVSVKGTRASTAGCGNSYPRSPSRILCNKSLRDIRA